MIFVVSNIGDFDIANDHTNNRIKDNGTIPFNEPLENDRFLLFSERFAYWTSKLQADINISLTTKTHHFKVFAQRLLWILGPLLLFLSLLRSAELFIQITGILIGFNAIMFFCYQIRGSIRKFFLPLEVSLLSLAPMTVNDRKELSKEDKCARRHVQILSSLRFAVILYVVVVMYLLSGFVDINSQGIRVDKLQLVVMLFAILLPFGIILSVLNSRFRIDRLKNGTMSCWQLWRLSAVESNDSLVSMVFALVFLIAIRMVFFIFDTILPNADPRVWEWLYLPTFFLALIYLLFLAVVASCTILLPRVVIQGKAPLVCIIATYMCTLILYIARCPGWIASPVTFFGVFILAKQFGHDVDYTIPTPYWIRALFVLILIVSDYILGILFGWLGANTMIWSSLLAVTLCGFFFSNVIAARQQTLANDKTVETY